MNLFDGKNLALPKAFIVVVLTSSSYNITVLHSSLIGLLPIYFLSLLYLAKVEKMRHAFYLGWIACLITFSIHIRFFLNIFGNGSIILWIILSFWPALFILLSRILLFKLSKKAFLLVVPCLFFVLEIISSELYPLRFSWTASGYMTAPNSYSFGLQFIGIYGFSLLTLFLTLYAEQSQKRKFLLPSFMLLLTATSFIKISSNENGKGPIISGIQLEFPELVEALEGLDKVKKSFPETDIFMLSEYSFNNGIPEPVKAWCRKNNAYLLTGTTFNTEDKQNFYNTATVINPKGEIDFKQVKAQPIQFFNDGLPALEQKLWDSPWGKIGMCICYDLSYTRVVDKLVDLGAEGLLVPTMDVASWGQSEHELHERVAPLRATEYGLPIFKVASSGISQSVNAQGSVIASASFPGQGEIISSKMILGNKGTKPFDRYLFWPCALICLFGFYSALIKKKELSSEP